MLKNVRKKGVMIFLWLAMTPLVDANSSHALKLKGDIRLRIQSEDKKDAAVFRVRERIRFRFGGTKQVNDMANIGFGLASGDDDQRSTNQTLENGFQTPDIRLDYAYIDLTPMKGVLIRGGKGKNLLWRPTNLLWDMDINPDGVAGKVQVNANTLVHWGLFTLDEVKSSKNDPKLFVIQPVMKIRHGEASSSKVALSYYQAINTVKNPVTGDDKDKSDDDLFPKQTKEYSPVAVSYEWRSSVNNLPMKAFGEYVSNGSAGSKKDGYIFGVKLGKAKKMGTWDVSIAYRSLQENAWFGFLTDSDAYGGKTDVQGVEFMVNYAIRKNIALSLDVYSMDRIDATSNSQLLVQADLKVKF